MRLHGPVRVQLPAAQQVDLTEVVGEEVGPGERRLRRLRPLDRQELRAVQLGVRPGIAERNIGGITGMPAATQERLLHEASRVVAPTRLVVIRDTAEESEAFAVDAQFDAPGHPVPGTARNLDRAARIGEAALGRQQQGPSQGIASVQGARARDQFRVADREFGDGFPVHGFGEGFILSNAIDIHRNARGRSQQRGQGEAVEEQVRLPRIALRLGDVDALEVFPQQVGEGLAVQLLHVVGLCALHVQRNLVGRHVQSRQRRHADHDDLAQLLRRR